MNFDQLHQFEAITTHGTISAAAQQLRISQPALSRSLARLETELGTPLFDRNGRALELNKAGETAREFVRAILHEERLMRAALDELANKEHSLIIGTVAPAPLWRLTAHTIERFPERMLSSKTMHQQDIERELINRNLDMGITRKPLRYPAIRSCPLMDETLAISVPNDNPLAQCTSVSFQDIDGEDFILMGNIGFWDDLVHEKMPHSSFLVQEDRVVFEQLSRTTPLLRFVTDAAYLAGEMPGRTVVPLRDREACVHFYLLVHADGSRQAAELFEWVQSQSIE